MLLGFNSRAFRLALMSTVAMFTTAFQVPRALRGSRDGKQKRTSASHTGIRCFSSHLITFQQLREVRTEQGSLLFSLPYLRNKLRSFTFPTLSLFGHSPTFPVKTSYAILLVSQSANILVLADTHLKSLVQSHLYTFNFYLSTLRPQPTTISLHTDSYAHPIFLNYLNHHHQHNGCH